jgi:hypothetical protein
MLELMDGINTFVLAGLRESGTTDISTIYEDDFAGDSQEELMCRHDVCPLIARRYLTGGYWAQFSFSYYSKSMQTLAARQRLDAIEIVLFIDNFTDLLGLREGRLQEIARPTFISKDETGASVFTSSYKLEYFVEV